MKLDRVDTVAKKKKYVKALDLFLHKFVSKCVLICADCLSIVVTPFLKSFLMNTPSGHIYSRAVLALVFCRTTSQNNKVSVSTFLEIEFICSKCADHDLFTYLSLESIV